MWNKAKEDPGKHSKFKFLWIGPYVINQNHSDNSYLLAHPNDTLFNYSTNGQYLKKYYTWCLGVVILPLVVISFFRVVVSLSRVFVFFRVFMYYFGYFYVLLSFVAFVVYIFCSDMLFIDVFLLTLLGLLDSLRRVSYVARVSFIVRVYVLFCYCLFISEIIIIYFTMIFLPTCAINFCFWVFTCKFYLLLQLWPIFLLFISCFITAYHLFRGCFSYFIVIYQACIEKQDLIHYYG